MNHSIEHPEPTLTLEDRVEEVDESEDEDLELSNDDFAGLSMNEDLLNHEKRILYGSRFFRLPICSNLIHYEGK